MTTTETDDLVPVMLRRSVVNSVEADRLSGEIDPRVLLSIGNACNDALRRGGPPPDFMVETLAEYVADAWAGDESTSWEIHHEFYRGRSERWAVSLTHSPEGTDAAKYGGAWYMSTETFEFYGPTLVAALYAATGWLDSLAAWAAAEQSTTTVVTP